MPGLRVPSALARVVIVAALVLATLIPARPAAARGYCGKPRKQVTYGTRLMRVVVDFDLSRCDTVDRSLQGPYLLTQPDFVVYGVMHRDGMTESQVIQQFSGCFVTQPACRMTFRLNHDSIERAEYTVHVLLVQLKGGASSSLSLVRTCTSAVVTASCRL